MNTHLPEAAYGSRTAALQRIIEQAEALPFLPLEVGPIATAARMLAQHMAALKDQGVAVPDLRRVKVVKGTASAFHSSWGAGHEWRTGIGEVIARLHKAHSTSRDGEFLKAPIWPAGKINVFGIVLFATDKRWRQCEQAARTGDEAETFWAEACFVEKVIDARLVSVVFGDAEHDAVFAPLMEVVRMGILPMGWEGDCIQCFRFADSDVPTASETIAHLLEPSP